MVAPDTRNPKVVAWLILSMTAGAAALLWLEAPTRGWSAPTPLMAERGRLVQTLLIEFACDDEPVATREFDGVILPDGRCDWRPRGPQIRLLVIGSRTEKLAAPAARTLLALLGSLQRERGLDLRRVRLHPESDSLLNPRLPPASHDLRSLLLRKAIIQ